MNETCTRKKQVKKWSNIDWTKTWRMGEFKLKYEYSQELSIWITRGKSRDV